MGMGMVRTLSTGQVPVWQGTDDDIQLVQGGFLLDVTGLTPGAILPMGTPMIYDEANRTAKPITVGVVYENAGASATAYKVTKGSRFAVGNNFSAVAGGAAEPISAIDTTDPNFDLITVSTTIGAVAAGAFVFASPTTGAAAAALTGVNGLLYEERAAYFGETCSIVIRGTCYARRVPYSPDLQAALKAANCHIIYSQSK